MTAGDGPRPGPRLSRGEGCVDGPVWVSLMCEYDPVRTINLDLTRPKSTSTGEKPGRSDPIPTGGVGRNPVVTAVEIGRDLEVGPGTTLVFSVINGPHPSSFSPP